MVFRTELSELQNLHSDEDISKKRNPEPCDVYISCHIRRNKKATASNFEKVKKPHRDIPLNVIGNSLHSRTTKNVLLGRKNQQNRYDVSC